MSHSSPLYLFLVAFCPFAPWEVPDFSEIIIFFSPNHWLLNAIWQLVIPQKAVLLIFLQTPNLSVTILLSGTRTAWAMMVFFFFFPPIYNCNFFSWNFLLHLCWIWSTKIWKGYCFLAGLHRYNMDYMEGVDQMTALKPFSESPISENIVPKCAN